MSGKAERTDAVQLEEEKAQGDLTHVCKYLIGGNENEGRRFGGNK